MQKAYLYGRQFALIPLTAVPCFSFLSLRDELSTEASLVLYPQLFPKWKGTFDGSRPSLAGLDNERVIAALEGGLMAEGEVAGLLHLIREPDVSNFSSSG